MRRTFTSAYKAEVVQEMLRGEKTISQIAADRQLHPVLLSQWKKAILKGMPTLLDDKASTAMKAAHEVQIQELFEQIGRLTIENAWLKKKSGLINTNK